MVYTCDTCHFIFVRVGPVDSCPDCGKPSIREADKPEQIEYWRNVRDMDQTETEI